MMLLSGEMGTSISCGRERRDILPSRSKTKEKENEGNHNNSDFERAVQNLYLVNCRERGKGFISVHSVHIWTHGGRQMTAVYFALCGQYSLPTTGAILSIFIDLTLVLDLILSYPERSCNSLVVFPSVTLPMHNANLTFS